MSAASAIVSSCTSLRKYKRRFPNTVDADRATLTEIDLVEIELKDAASNSASTITAMIISALLRQIERFGVRKKF